MEIIQPSSSSFCEPPRLHKSTSTLGFFKETNFINKNDIAAHTGQIRHSKKSFHDNKNTRPEKELLAIG